MSRHRNIRNIDLDDDEYGDPDYWDDRSYSVSPDIPSEYLIVPGDDGQDKFSELISQAQEASMLNLATQEVRNVLGENYSNEEVDAALRQADYDPQRAVELLLDSTPSNNDGAQAQKLREAVEPSQFGALMSDDTARQGHQKERPNLAGQMSSLSLIQDGQRGFKFDEPSPDDLRTSARAKPSKTAASTTVKSGTAASTTLKAGTAAVKTGTAASTTLKTGTAAASIANPENIDKPVKSKLAEQSTVEPEAAQRNGQKVKSSAEVKSVVKRKQREQDPPKTLLERELNNISVVVVGHVDAGKSTLIGQILASLSAQTNRRPLRVPGDNLAWLLDEDDTEREKGVTVDIGVRQMKAPSGKTINIIDSPGHRDFVPMMIVGASMASVAVLVVDSTTGEFEAGFGEEGQTREHAVLLRSIGISQLVVACNKMDGLDFSEERFREIESTLHNFLKSSGFKVPENVRVIPCSGLKGDNVVKKPPSGHPLSNWYSGPSVLDAIEEFEQRVVASNLGNPTRFAVYESFKTPELGTAVSGKVLSGTLAPGDTLLILPQKQICTVKLVQVGGEKVVALAGDTNVTLPLSYESGVNIAVGDILADPEKPAPVVLRFRAQIQVLNVQRPFVQGTQGVLHVNGTSEAATVEKLLSVVRKEKAGPQNTSRPRTLKKGQRASVVIRLHRGLCLETYSNLKAMGWFVLRNSGRTMAVGIVDEIMTTEDEDSA